MVSIQWVSDDHELMVITQNGMILRTPVSTVRTIGRNTQGVRLIQLEEGDKVVAAARLAEKENNGDEDDREDSGTGDEEKAEHER